jgi:hypothetical protein
VRHPSAEKKPRSLQDFRQNLRLQEYS